MTEAIGAIVTTKEHPEYIAALAKRGITDLDDVQIDPWPAGVFGYECEDGRRITRCISFLRTDPTDNGYARPIEGLIVHFDMARQRGHRGDRPRRHRRCRRTAASYYAEDQPRMREDLKPISITQPEGPSFTVDGNLVDWQKWRSASASIRTRASCCTRSPTTTTAARRSILHRASISEMVVPYGDPSPLHGWKNAFDAGEWGLGRMTQPLTLGCDCLGEIHYFDATLANEQGKPWVIPNAICMHEEDYGILWKHVDLHGRSRRRCAGAGGSS